MAAAPKRRGKARADECKVYTASPGIAPIAISCTHLKGQLYEMRKELKKQFPGEFKQEEPQMLQYQPIAMPFLWPALAPAPAPAPAAPAAPVPVGWNALRALNWPLRSDRRVTQAQLRDQVMGLRASGHWPPIAAHIVAAAPQVQAMLLELGQPYTANAVYQIVALGRDTMDSIETEPTLLEYLLTETQDADLYAFVSGMQ